MNSVITSFLDQDLYKFTMAQVVWEKFPSAEVEYAYKCRTEADLSIIADELQEQVEMLGTLSTTPEELEYLKSIRYFKPGFINLLRHFRMNPEEVTITKNPFSLKIRCPWQSGIFWEIFLLSTISELYYKKTLENPESYLPDAREKLQEKINYLKEETATSDMPFRLIEFGSRRRYSQAWQEEVLKKLKTQIPHLLFGTSNVDLARRYNLRAIGTFAHEYLQAFQAFVRLRNSQKDALQTWADVYRGDLGIALTDVISMNAFLRDFDLYFAKLFDGMRHDSGDPFAWARKAINHYKTFRINPLTKSLVFSDSLTMAKAVSLWKEFEPYIQTSFGIGTHLTCDIPNVVTLNHVIKMIRCNGQPVAKESDSPGKSMCEDEGYRNYLKQTFNYPN